MGFIWNHILKPVLKGALHVLDRVFTWSKMNPVASLGIGVGILLLIPLAKDRPYLQSLMLAGAGWLVSGSLAGVPKLGYDIAKQYAGTAARHAVERGIVQAALGPAVGGVVEFLRFLF